MIWDIIAKYYIELILTSLTTVVTAVLLYVGREFKKFRAQSFYNSEGTKALLRDKIYYYHKRYVIEGDGTIPSHVLGIINKIYNAYKGLSGNDIGDRLYNEILELDVIQVT